MFINFELCAYFSELHKEVLMEKLMGNTLVRLRLLHYYLPPIEAKA